MRDHEHRNSKLTGPLQSVDLAKVTIRWPVGLRVVVEDAVVTEVVGVVNAGVKYTDGDPDWIYVSGALGVDPDSLSAAVRTPLAQVVSGEIPLLALETCQVLSI